jgi:hypothetical protein
VTELPRHLSGKGLVRHYDELDPEERFRFAIEARARGDRRELKRLADTCPMKCFRISDPADMDRVDASRDIATALALDLGPWPRPFGWGERCERPSLTGSLRRRIPVGPSLLLDLADAEHFPRDARQGPGIDDGKLLSPPSTEDAPRARRRGRAQPPDAR